MYESWETRLRNLDERLSKFETTFDQQKIKLDHEMPKTVAKLAKQSGQKMEKKVLGILKD